MQGTRLERLAPLSGMFSVLALVVSAVVINRWDYLPDAGDIGAFLEETSTRVTVGGYVGLVGAFLLMWFAASVRSHIEERDGGPSRSSALAFGGILGSGIVMTLAYAMVVAAAARAGSTGGIPDTAALVMYDGYASLAGGMSVTMAVALAAYAGFGFRTGAEPRWLVLVTGLLAVGSLTPLAWIFIGVDALWIAVVSARIFLREEPSPGSGEVPAAGSPGTA